ncbi:MAG: methyltransferase domain-containing protein [Phycisphaerae bacterium]|nr:methyltransferase domain-containing protein [Phycisphaerae bacterium]
MRHRRNPNQKSRNPNQKYHDRVAAKYEQIYDDSYWQWHDALTWDYIKRFLPTNQAVPVLDLGCGSGKWGRKLLKSGYRVTFVDLSIKMVDEARKQVEETGGADKAEFLQADLMDLSRLPAETFGFAVALGEPLGCTEDPGKALREVARCLAPGGVLVASFDNRIACIDYYIKNGQVAELEAFLRNGRTKWLTRDETEQFQLHTFTPDQLRKLFVSANLEPIEIIGKTVLPMRPFRELLEESETRRRLARIEKDLASDPANFGRCAHLQVAGKKPALPAR